MRNKSVKLADIAKELDLDISTVSKALNDHPKINKKTKKEVQKVARQLNYHRNSIATALVKGKSNLVGVMVPYTDENFFASVIRGIDHGLKNNDYRIIIFQSYDDIEVEKNNIETMFRTQVDGIIASHAMKTENFEHYQDILARGMPLVLFDRFNDSIDSDVVAIDDFKGAYKAVSHLIDQGCKNIAHIAGYQNVHIYQERLRGYRQALLDNDFTFSPANVFKSDMSLEDARRITSAVIQKKGDLPDAFFCSNDYTALGAIQILQENGIDIPEQISIVGFSNEDFTSFVTPSITSIDQHSREMGEIAAQHFFNQISSEKHLTKKEFPTKTILTPELVVRDSSRKKSL